MLWWTRRKLKSPVEETAVSAAEQLRASSSDIRNLSVLAECLHDPRNAVKQAAENAFLESLLTPEVRAQLAIKAGAYTLAARVALANPRPRKPEVGPKSKSGLFGEFLRESRKELAEALRVQDRIAEALGEVGQQPGAVEALLFMMERRPSSGLVGVLEKFASTRREDIIKTLKAIALKTSPTVRSGEEPQFDGYAAGLSLLAALWSGPDAVRWFVRFLLSAKDDVFEYGGDHSLDVLVQMAGPQFKEALAEVCRSGGNKLKPRVIEAMKRHAMGPSEIAEIARAWRNEHAPELRDLINGIDEVLRLLEKEGYSERSKLKDRIGEMFDQTRQVADESVLPAAFKFLKLLEKPPETYRRGYDKCCKAVVPVMLDILQYFASRISTDDLRLLAKTPDLRYERFVRFAADDAHVYDWEEYEPGSVECSEIRDLATRELSRRGLSVSAG